MKYPHHISISFFLLFLIPTFGQPIQAIDSLELLIQNETSDTVRVNLLNELALEYQNINHDSSIYYLSKSLIIARELGESKFKAYIYTRLGANYCFKGEYLKALEYLDLAENIVLEHPNTPVHADIHYFRSIVFLHLDKLQEANEQATSALGFYRELNYSDKVLRVYTLFCYIFEKLDNKQKSLEFAFKSYRISLQLNDPKSISASLNNVGTRYLLLNNIDSALFYVRKAIELNKQNNNRVWLAINYHNMAEILYEQREIDSADFYIQQASKIYRNIGHMMNFYSSQEIRAKISLAKKDTLSAIEYYNTIIKSPKHLENLKIKVIAYKALYDIAYNSGRYVEAIDYFKSYKLFDDSLKKETNTSLLSVMELQMEFEKQRSRLELENSEVKLYSQRKNFYIFLLAGIILLLGITIYYVNRLQRAKARTIRIEKQLVDEELDFKNREMTANVMSLMKKNEILAELSKSLLEVEKNAVKDETKFAINKIAKKIRKTRDDEIWEEFNIRFKEVHNDFHNNLLQQYPGLSPSEQRLCAFLRMNMSTKEISELSGVHPRSIDNARSKIRKKLGITGDVNLVSFLARV